MLHNDEFLYRLRNANPIETVMGTYVNLVKRGRNYLCSCPFHSEKTPSCTVFTDTQSFYCFGCGAGGDVITFIKKIENLEFPEAVRLLAQRSGIELPHNSLQESLLAKRRTRIYEMNRLAANFFYTNLIKGKDKQGLEYFMNRKLTPQTIKKYGLGYASDSWDDLCRMLRSKGYSEEEIIDAWLGGRSKKNNNMYDMFRKRVMFPIVNKSGNIIGFGGRVLDNSQPKYLNTGNTPVFNKRHNLFSLNFARNSDSKQIIICEGYMDVIALNQAGFENTVATLGTAITQEQVRLLNNSEIKEVIIAYDCDGAGQAATQKAINYFSEIGMNTRILRLEGAKDPDEYIKKFGALRFRKLLDESFDATVFMLDKCEVGADLSTEMGRAQFLKKVSRILVGIDDKIERELYISRMSKKCDIPVHVLEDYINDMVKKSKHYEKKQEWRNITATTTFIKDDLNPEAQKFRKEARAEECIIYYLLRRPEEWKKAEETAPPEIFVTSFNKRLYEAMLQRMKDSEHFTMSMLADEFSPDEMGKISGIEAKNRDFNINAEVFVDCVNVLKKSSVSHISQENEISNDDLLGLFKSKSQK